MARIVLTLLPALLGQVAGYAYGPPPDCQLEQPTGHRVQESSRQDLKATFKVTNAGEKVFKIDIKREEPLRGLLLRLDNSSPVRGKFSKFDEELFKDLEGNGDCVAHRRPADKSAGFQIEFTAEEVAQTPKFDAIIVGKNSQEWWRVQF